MSTELFLKKNNKIFKEVIFLKLSEKCKFKKCINNSNQTRNSEFILLTYFLDRQKLWRNTNSKTLKAISSRFWYIIYPASEKQSNDEFWNESKNMSYMPGGHVQVLQKQQKKQETTPRGISDHFTSIFAHGRFDTLHFWITRCLSGFPVLVYNRIKWIYLSFLFLKSLEKYTTWTVKVNKTLKINNFYLCA